MMTKRTKLILVDVVFIILDLVITWLMFKLWFWLFTNKIILTILLTLTLLGLAKQVWKSVGNLFEHWQSKD